MAEKATPVTPDEADDIRVTLDLDNGSVECKIITIFDADHKDYIALLPLDKNGNENESGEVYLYRYFEDEEGIPRIENIESDDEYEAAADCMIRRGYCTTGEAPESISMSWMVWWIISTDLWHPRQACSNTLI